MMIPSQEKIENVQGRSIWSFANDILYEMCKENSNHQQDEITIGKILLIGRSYAAALERRKRSKDPNQYASDELYRRFAETLRETDFDLNLQGLKAFQQIDEANIMSICSVHAFLMDIFRTLTGSEKRSLASKYLHFHFPDLFFIYDSFAVAALKTYIPRYSKQETPIGQLDPHYYRFCIGMITFRDEIKRTYGRSLKPRQLDDLLLNR